MTDDQIQLLKWFKINYRNGRNYSQSLDDLFSLRQSEKRSEVAFYETFCFMTDDEWLQVKSEVEYNS